MILLYYVTILYAQQFTNKKLSCQRLHDAPCRLNFAKSLRITQGSFEITPLTGVCVSSYSYSTVTMSLSCTVYEIFNVE